MAGTDPAEDQYTYRGNYVSASLNMASCDSQAHLASRKAEADSKSFSKIERTEIRMAPSGRNITHKEIAAQGKPSTLARQPAPSTDIGKVVCATTKVSGQKRRQLEFVTLARHLSLALVVASATCHCHWRGQH